MTVLTEMTAIRMTPANLSLARAVDAIYAVRLSDRCMIFSGQRPLKFQIRPARVNFGRFGRLNGSSGAPSSSGAPKTLDDGTIIRVHCQFAGNLIYRMGEGGYHVGDCDVYLQGNLDLGLWVSPNCGVCVRECIGTQ